MNGIIIDVPQLAYKTWVINIVDRNSGKRMIEAEKHLENDLKEYRFNKKHEHVR